MVLMDGNIQKLTDRKVPKWVMPDGSFNVSDQTFDITETMGKNSRFLEEQKIRDKARETRVMIGMCDKCRNYKCLCREGQ